MLGYVAGGALLQVADPRVIVIACGILGLFVTLGARFAFADAPKLTGELVKETAPSHR